jgi:hypothetical protein
MIKAVKKLVILSIAVLWAATQSTVALELADEPGQAALSEAETMFVKGNVAFALLHEMAHAIIADFDVPILGLEENAADTIAAVALILRDRESPDARFSASLGVTALVQAYVWQAGIEREHSEVVLWAQHGLSAQRFARLVCLLYGSDPDRFGWVAESAEMDEIRGEGCEHEWQTAERAFLWLLDEFAVREDGGAVHDVYAVSADGTDIALVQGRVFVHPNLRSRDETETNGAAIVVRTNHS